jgi:stearoyl-CoA desaturase (delta-9 desaturase)
MEVPRSRSWRHDYFNPQTIPFWTVHVGAIAGVAILGWSWWGLVWAVASYFLRVFFITAGYHRYFSHRAFRTSRWFQFVLAFGGGTAVQKGPLWWAAHHRAHHKHADEPEDPHSPRQRGLLWAHVGWITSDLHNETRLDRIGDFAAYPELRWLDRFHWVPWVVYATVWYLAAGLEGFLWGFVVSTVLVWHGTFLINSLAHRIGTRRYEQRGDDSRNHWLLAFLTMGEGWHNNHHHYPSAANQGFYWWEYDPTYYVLRGLALAGIVSGLRRPPARVLEDGRPRAKPRRPAAKPVASTALT